MIERIVQQAATLQVRAPEAALVLAEHAAAMSETAGANELWVHAEGLVVRARVTLGHRAPTVGRAVAALRAAEDAEQIMVAAQLRTDLAVCARSVGIPLTGLTVLRPALTVDDQPSPQRAAALAQLTGCLGNVGCQTDLEQVLREGDRVVGADNSLDQDSMLLTKALLRVGLSAHRRRQGDLLGAADAAHTGIGLLDQLEDPSADGGLVRVRLVLELVCALLDRGETESARHIADSVLNEPERAASIAPAGWLRLAVATRVHMHNGASDTAVRMLRDAAYGTGQQGLHALAGRLWLELAHVEERVGEPTEAVQCLHRARVAEQLHGRMRRQAHALLLSEFGSGEQNPVDLTEILAPATPADPVAAPGSTAPPYPDHGREQRSTHSGSRVLPMWGKSESRAGQAGSGTSAGASSEPQSVGPRSGRSTPVSPVVDVDPQDSSDVADATAQTRQSPDSEPTVNTRSSRRSRHDGEQGSIAARSVLDRLGISSSGSGGRRRAVGDEDSEDTTGSESADISDADPVTEDAAETREPGADGPPASDPTPAADRTTSEGIGPEPEYSAPVSAPEPVDNPHPADRTASSEKEPAEENSPSGPADDFGWLPKLRLPPALAPLEGFDTDDSVSADSPSSAPSSDTPPAALAESADTEELGGVTGEQAGEEPNRTTEELRTAGEHPGPEAERTRPDPADEQLVPAEEPSSDAGLAELLTQALAEHRAGTSSASALVKQLGMENDEASHINGKHRNDG